MGRKTFDSIGKALPKRKNIIISSNLNFKVPNGFVVKNMQEALTIADSEEVFIVGGASIYEQSMLIANKMYITKVHHSFKGDTFFPEIDPKVWQVTAQENHFKDEKHAFDFSFITYEKIS